MTEKDDADIAKYIPETLELVVYQGVLKDIDTKEQPTDISYIENLEFQIMLTNYFTSPNSIHICFPMKI